MFDVSDLSDAYEKGYLEGLKHYGVNSVLGDLIDEWISDLETEDIYVLPKLLEKMKDFRVKHFI